MPGALNDLSFSPDGESLAVANQNITLLSLSGGRVIKTLRDDHANYGSVRFTPDGRSLLTVNGKGAVMTISLSTGEVRPAYCCTSIWGDAEFAPDSQRVIWAGHWPGLRDLSGYSPIGRLTESRQFMAFGPIAVTGGGTVFMGSQDGRVYQWTLETRKLVRTSAPQTGYVRTIALLGDSGWIASAAEGGPVHLWHPETGSSRIVESARATSNLVFDRIHNLTAFGTASGEVEFWDLLDTTRRIR